MFITQHTNTTIMVDITALLWREIWEYEKEDVCVQFVNKFKYD